MNKVVRKAVKLCRSEKIQFFVIYSLVFLCMMRVCFVFFDEAGKGYGWAIDSLPVQFPMLAELRDFIRGFIEKICYGESFSLSNYDFRLGMGADSLTYLSMWYLEPIAFVSAFFDNNRLEILYDFLAMFRIYLAGLSFGVYCFYRKRTGAFAIVCGALVYVYSGWSFFFLRHPVFYATLIYMPLLLIGVEEILRNKRSLFLSLIVFFSAVTHYYFLYINTIIIGVYFLVRYWEVSMVKSWKSFWRYLYRLIGRYFLGIGLSAILLVPNIITFLNSNRMNPIIETRSLWHFGSDWLSKVILSIVAADYTPGCYLHNGFAAIGVICFIVCIIKKGMPIGYKVASLLCTIAFLFPFVTFALHVFSSVHFRWNYIIGFLFGLAVVRVFSEIQILTFRDLIAVTFFILLYSGIQAVNPKLANANTVSSTFFLLILTFLLMLYVNLQRKNKYRFYYLFIESILFLTCCNIYYNAKNVYSADFGNYIAEFVDKNSSYNQIVDTSASAILKRKNDFYRIDSANSGVKNENASIFLNHYGISFYVNVMDKYLAEYNYGLENRGTRLLDTLDNDNRAIMEALASVRYYTIYEGEEACIPYGYTFAGQRPALDGRICKIYENDYFLPLGYTYSQYIHESDYNQLNALEKQEALIQAVVVDDTMDCGDGLIEKGKINSIVEEENNIVIHGVGCEYNAEEKKVTVYQSGGFLMVEFPGKPNCETYVRLNNLNINAYDNAYWIVSFFNDERLLNKTIEARSNTATYSYDCYNYLVNLGYSQNAVTSINIGFPFVGEFDLDDIQIYYQPMENYEKQIEDLTENKLENISESCNEITGTINLKENKMLAFSIPYNIGWTAYVDGKKTDLERINITYMGLYLEKGKHNIRLSYITPGLRIGCFITCCSIIIFVILIIVKKQRKNC